ncbi:MAG: RNA methyltransferase [Betaproteobacteria bacterium]|nr:RNA methyltransferase [Betaproteobacteria bacterium]MDH5221282.1 RNA methyltransferase [Betaproteobacteria bacterium]MDH5350324.1 RNA methyltransferase [Betaproteobacteria bacterium]
MSLLRSRDNPRVRRWRALARDIRLRRRERRALLEGVHLLAAYLDSGARPVALLISESGERDAETAALVRRAQLDPVRLSDSAFRWMADAQAPTGLAAEIPLPDDAAAAMRDATHAVFLDGIQDAGNVGAILRSAAAFGVDTAVLGPGCADPWSPKVLRAAMGGHFALRVAEAPDLPAALGEFRGRLACAVARGGAAPASLDLSGPLGWILGAEGQGVSPAAAALAALQVTIPLARGTESLNVAAAAAVLLYERARQLSTRGARS